AAGDILGELAHLQGADGRSVLDHFQAAEDVAFGVGQGLALLGTQGLGDALGVLADQRLQLEHDAHAGADRGFAPGGEGALGSRHGGIDFLHGGERHPCQHLLGGRVDDIAPLGGLGLDPLAVDQQLDLLDLGLVGGVGCVHLRSPWNYCRDEIASAGQTRGGALGSVSSIDVQTSNKNAQKNRIIMQKDLTSLSSLNWDDLKFFLEVARTRKASSAAKRLGVDYTTVSRRIGSLEGALGTLLFE